MSQNNCREFISKFDVPPVNPDKSPRTCGLCKLYNDCPTRRSPNSNDRTQYPGRTFSDSTISFMNSDTVTTASRPSGSKKTGERFSSDH
ncbi:MAG TPA: hypothetical protein VF828_00450 [Patescibacteria group bacterium]